MLSTNLASTGLSAVSSVESIHVHRPRCEELAFTVRVAASELDLRRVQQLREAAYDHHLPGQAADFGRPDPLDRSEGVLILLAECKRTGAVVGSARIQVNRTAPLVIERSISLPPALQGRLLCEITRLTVSPI